MQRDGTKANRTRNALRRMAKEDPELATRLLAQALPGAAARLPERLLLMLARLPRLPGTGRRGLKLRLAEPGEPAASGNGRGAPALDIDAMYRSLEYLIDPEWTRGHRFTVAYEVTASDGSQPSGTWYVEVRDGEPVRVTREPPGAALDATARVTLDTYRRLLTRELTPSQAMQRQLTAIDGDIYPVTLLGRWIDRSQGRDGAELRREEDQRRVQSRRTGTWGATSNGAGAGQGDPAHESEAARRAGGELLTYSELYALWERQNWRAHELDFSIDKEHWLATPREAQENTIWSLGSFYIGEERVTADLAPFLLAAPSGEIELFLSTQLVDEARHAAFFDRFGAEVMALESEDLRGRLRELEQTMLPAWHEVFDGALRGIANRIKERPDDLDLFVEGITTYHLIIEGVLAMTGQRLILQYMEDHGLYPGFQQGFSLVERDEHRHIAFGVRFLKEMVEREPRYGDLIERKVAELVPRAVHVFCPPYAESPREFVSYGYRSSEIYGYAYRALKRRMSVVGLEVPPAEELMPGPIAEPEPARAAAVPA